MKKNTFNTVTEKAFNGFRIDKFLQLKLNNLSRTRLQNLIKDEHVKINGALVKTSSKKIEEEVFIVKENHFLA